MAQQHNIDTSPWDAMQQHIELHYPQYAQQYPPQRYQVATLPYTTPQADVQLAPENTMPVRDPFQALGQARDNANNPMQQQQVRNDAKPVEFQQLNDIPQTYENALKGIPYKATEQQNISRQSNTQMPISAIQIPGDLFNNLQIASANPQRLGGIGGYHPKPFPTNPNLPKSAYPDVTQKVNEVVKQYSEKAKDVLAHFGWSGVSTLFAIKFPPKGSWDTKINPAFPGNQGGKAHYALYKGEIVPENYIANNVYGQVCASVGMSRSVAHDAAQAAAVGANMLKYHQFQLDQVEDEWSIDSGYDDYIFNNPWLKGKYAYIKKQK